jgi:hypothetical protein
MNVTKSDFVEGVNIKLDGMKAEPVMERERPLAIKVELFAARR